jgi:hypothetical protein
MPLFLLERIELSSNGHKNTGDPVPVIAIKKLTAADEKIPPPTRFWHRGHAKRDGELLSPHQDIYST